MSRYVVDANTTLAWLLNERELLPYLPADFTSASWVVPWLWRAEVTNGIVKNERKKKITVAHGTRLLQIADSLAVELVGEPVQRSLEMLASFARQHDRTPYDALYLEVAVAYGLPLCTFDRGLQTAALRLGVPLLVDWAKIRR